MTGAAITGIAITAAATRRRSRFNNRPAMGFTLVEMLLAAGLGTVLCGALLQLLLGDLRLTGAMAQRLQARRQQQRAAPASVELTQSWATTATMVASIVMPPAPATRASSPLVPPRAIDARAYRRRHVQAQYSRDVQKEPLHFRRNGWRRS